MDDALKNSLWNSWYTNIYNVLVRTSRDHYQIFFNKVWIYLLKAPVDIAPLDHYPSLLEEMKQYL